MDWIILFVVNWILFLLLKGWKGIKANIWCGLLAVAMQLSIDTQAMEHGYYKVDNKVLGMWGSSFFFVLGPVLVIGILLAKYHPQKRLFSILHVIILGGLYSLQEMVLLFRKDLTYTNWNYTDSLVVNFAAIAILSWFSIVVLKKKGV